MELKSRHTDLLSTHRLTSASSPRSGNICPKISNYPFKADSFLQMPSDSRAL